MTANVKFRQKNSSFQIDVYQLNMQTYLPHNEIRKDSPHGTLSLKGLVELLFVTKESN